MFKSYKSILNRISFVTFIVFLLVACSNEKDNFCDLQTDTYDAYKKSIENYYEVHGISNEPIISIFTIDEKIEADYAMLDVIASQESTITVSLNNKVITESIGAIGDLKLKPGTYYIEVNGDNDSGGLAFCFNKGKHYVLTFADLDKTIQYINNKKEEIKNEK